MKRSRLRQFGYIACGIFAVAVARVVFADAFCNAPIVTQTGPFDDDVICATTQECFSFGEDHGGQGMCSPRGSRLFGYWCGCIVMSRGPIAPPNAGGGGGSSSCGDRPLKLAPRDSWYLAQQIEGFAANDVNKFSFEDADVMNLVQTDGPQGSFAADQVFVLDGTNLDTIVEYGSEKSEPMTVASVLGSIRVGAPSAQNPSLRYLYVTMFDASVNSFASLHYDGEETGSMNYALRDPGESHIVRGTIDPSTGSFEISLWVKMSNNFLSFTASPDFQIRAFGRLDKGEGTAQVTWLARTWMLASNS